MSVIDPNFHMYLYRLRVREFEKTAAGPTNRLFSGIGQALRGGVKKTLKKTWKPALLAGAVGVPLWAGSRIAQSEPAKSPLEEAQSARSKNLRQGSGRYQPPSYQSAGPRNPYLR